MNINNITVHTLVKNEEKWIWFSIMSVINFVDKLIIFDTGSTDSTVHIIKEILKNEEYAKKISFEEKGSISTDKFSLLRQEQIDKTNTDWFLVLDGDEIWYEEDIKRVVSIIQNTTKKMLAIRFHNCTKDIFHYSKFDSGSYNIKGVKGNITIKLICKNISGLAAIGPYGNEGYYDIRGNPIQNSENDIQIIDGFFLHTSNLVRSRNLYFDWKIPYRRVKVFSKVESKVGPNFVFPEVFYAERPKIVYNPFQKASILYYFFMLMLQPIRINNYLRRL
jgi:glycosyltransferase involved in cell wall biosynthesis